jgi:hypothetical protein
MLALWHHTTYAGYGVEFKLFEDKYLHLVAAANLKMDPALIPRLVSSVAFACMSNARQLNHLIERRHTYNPSVFRYDIHSTTQIGFSISILRIRWYI